jgi:hypothetical protein
MTPDEAPAKTTSWQLCCACHCIINHNALFGCVNQTQTSTPLEFFPIGRVRHTLQLLRTAGNQLLNISGYYMNFTRASLTLRLPFFSIFIIYNGGCHVYETEDAMIIPVQ